MKRILLAAIALALPGRAELPDAASYLAKFATAARVEWPGNHTLTVVCHGHSVPAGYAKTPFVDTFNAYPVLLHQRIKAAYPAAVVNVTVTAIGGENSVSGATRFTRDVLSLRPDVITLDYALNDRGIGLEKARAAWVEMIVAAQKAGVPILLLTPTSDMAAHLDDPADPLNQHAEQIRKLAAEFNVGLVDSLALFQQYIRAGGKLEELMSQPNHPNRRGHELVTEALAKWFTLPPAAK